MTILNEAAIINELYTITEKINETTSQVDELLRCYEAAQSDTSEEEISLLIVRKVDGIEQAASEAYGGKAEVLKAIERALGLALVSLKSYARRLGEEAVHATAEYGLGEEESA